MHGLRGMLLSRREGTLLKIRGCRSFFGISLSITPQVPFPYLRLRKKLEFSYSAIRRKWAGNRNFWAGRCSSATLMGAECRVRNAKVLVCVHPVRESMEKSAVTLAKRSASPYSS